MILSEFEKTARGKVVFNDGEIIAGIHLVLIMMIDMHI